MVSQEHEALVELFRNRLTLAAELGGALGVELPAWSAVHLGSAEFTDLVPAQYRADVVVELKRQERTVFALVVEVQLEPKERKRMVWPQYLASARARLECPAALLVVAPDPAVARWCGQPIALGHPGFVLSPVVFGPETLPVVKSEQEARQNPEWLVLSALMHGRSSAGEEIAQWLPGACAGLEAERLRMYLDLAASFLNEAARRTLEHLMRNYQYRTQFARQYVEEGRQVGHQEAEAAAVLTVLEARGFTLEAPLRERITSCKDLAQLQRWLRKAATLQSVQELFSPEPGSPH